MVLFHLKSVTGLLPLLLLLVLRATAAGQAGSASSEEMLSVRFSSEFRRVSPRDGSVAAADAAGIPREIISPAIVRNGYTSFYIVAAGPAGKPYRLFIAQNPEGLLRAALSRLAADGLGLQPLPKLEAEAAFNERGVAVYWLDVWTPAATPIRRIRLEAQLSFGSEWVITPLEMRVLPAAVPERPLPRAPRQALSAAVHTGSGAIAEALFAEYLCPSAAQSQQAGPLAAAVAATGIAARLLRNAGQDVLIARKLDAREGGGGRAAIEAAIAKALGVERVAAWCALPAEARRPRDPEVFLRIRDAIWRADR